MATATVGIPSSNHVLPGSHLLSTPRFPGPSTTDTETPDAKAVATQWVESLNQLISNTDASLSSLFVDESYWRDLLCFSWDFRTLQGPNGIATFVKNTSKQCRFSLDYSKEHKKPQIVAVGELKIIQAFLKVETSVGRGEGLVRLIRDPMDGRTWKAFTLFTTLKELKGHEENTHTRRPTGNDRDPVTSGMNWKDRRKAQADFEGGREPVVLILGMGHSVKSPSGRALTDCKSGAGQAGLTVAARLKQLGVETSIIDRNPRIGDNWRNRYHQLVLHDSVWYSTSNTTYGLH